MDSTHRFGVSPSYRRDSADETAKPHCCFSTYGVIVQEVEYEREKHLQHSQDAVNVQLEDEKSKSARTFYITPAADTYATPSKGA